LAFRLDRSADPLAGFESDSAGRIRVQTLPRSKRLDPGKCTPLLVATIKALFAETVALRRANGG